MIGSIFTVTTSGSVFNAVKLPAVEENNKRISLIETSRKNIESELSVNKELLAIVEGETDEAAYAVKVKNDELKREDEKQKDLKAKIKKEKERIKASEEARKAEAKKAEDEARAKEEANKVSLVSETSGSQSGQSGVTQSPVAPQPQSGEVSFNQPAPGSGMLNTVDGVAYLNGVKETYYSQRVLAGGGLNIPGRHVGQWGTVRDADGYIVGASDVLAKGSTTMSTLGPVKIYDTGVGHNGLDLYTDW